MSFPKLLSSLQLGRYTLKNRCIMAPLTRCRATIDHVPTDLMSVYYRQRASAGMIIAEATMVDSHHSAFLTEPGIYSADQIKAWKKVTSAVHMKGGLIFLQIWHGGRACLSANAGSHPIAPSSIAIEGKTLNFFNPTGAPQPYEVPREMTDFEIADARHMFQQAAVKAVEAGFDGVEIHGANGYLLDQFWKESSNHRSDAYGGSIENRSRMMLETVRAVTKAIGSDRVGLRISPINSYNSAIDSHPEELTKHLAKELSKDNLAFLHVMRSDFYGKQKGDPIAWVKSAYKGTVVANMGYTAEEAEDQITKGVVDAVAFGTKFLANPDLVERFAAKAPLNPMNDAKFYTQGAAGYTDYPFLKR